jgi:dTDP-4-amino-4,6-dideoxygalactose transaminase
MRQLAELYKEIMGQADVVLPREGPYVKHVYHLFAITNERGQLSTIFSEEWFQTQVHCPIPAHKQKAYKAFQSTKDFTITQTICSEILSLPLYPYREM